MKSAEPSTKVDPGARKVIPLPRAARRDRHELAFLPAALEIVETPPSPIGRAIGVTINGFNASHDVLQFNPALLANYAAVLLDTKQVGANTVIRIDATDSVTLVGVTASSLHANNFHFS